MLLFGWCLSDMSAEQHTKCIEAFDYGSTISCECLCHTDYNGFIKSKTTPVKDKKGKKK